MQHASDTLRLTWVVPAVAPRSPLWIYIPRFPWDWEAKEEGGEFFQKPRKQTLTLRLDKSQLLATSRRFFRVFPTSDGITFSRLSPRWTLPSSRLEKGRKALGEVLGSSLRVEPGFPKGLWPWPGVEGVEAFHRWGPHRRRGITGT